MKQELAVFDVDGTLIRGDSFVLYLVFVLLRRPSRWLRAPVLAFGVLLFMLSARDNSWLKAHFVHHVLGGLAPGSEQVLTERFVERLARTRVKPGGFATLRRHLDAGHLVILLSAGLDSYLRPLAVRLGVAHLVATRVERNQRGAMTGRLSGENCRGAEKLRRLGAFLGDAGPIGTRTAYTDHHSDLPLLLAVDVPIAVDPTRRLLALCARHGFAVQRWSDGAETSAGSA